MRESIIEAEGVKYAENRGWTVYKWASPGKRGIHDRLHLKNGIAFSIEYKATGEKASKLQRDEAKKLKAAGIACRCVDSVGRARFFIDTMDRVAEGAGYIDLDVIVNDISSFDP